MKVLEECFFQDGGLRGGFGVEGGSEGKKEMESEEKKERQKRTKVLILYHSDTEHTVQCAVILH